MARARIPGVTQPPGRDGLLRRWRALRWLHRPAGPLLTGRHRRPLAARPRMASRPWPAGRPGLTGRRAAAAAIACGVLICGTGVTGLVIVSQAGHAGLPAGQAPFVPVPHGRPAAPLAATADQQVARPVELIVPAIGVRASLIRLGITAAGHLQVPPNTTVAGWFTGSPRPGQIGSSVIAGHVDSYLGPGVFFRLRELRPADRIYVRRADGSLAVFRVTAVREFLKDRFPTAEVYGPVPDAQLRLITCGGIFDPALRSYLSNVVVFAVAVSGQHGQQIPSASRRGRDTRRLAGGRAGIVASDR
jgi:hypothetical protein